MGVCITLIHECILKRVILIMCCINMLQKTKLPHLYNIYRIIMLCTLSLHICKNLSQSLKSLEEYFCSPFWMHIQYLHTFMGLHILTHFSCLYGRNAWQKVYKDNTLPRSIHRLTPVVYRTHPWFVNRFRCQQITSKNKSSFNDCWQLIVTFYLLAQKTSVNFVQQAFCVPHTHLVYSTEMLNGTLKHFIQVKVISQKSKTVTVPLQYK